jgi:hypothetical protein
MDTNTASDIAIDCPWCAGPMETATESQFGDALTCRGCSIVVDLAPAGVTVPASLAA